MPERRWKICCVFLKDVWKDVRKTSCFTERRCHSGESKNKYSSVKKYNVFQENTMSFVCLSKRLSEKHNISSNVFQKNPRFSIRFAPVSKRHRHPQGARSLPCAPQWSDNSDLTGHAPITSVSLPSTPLRPSTAEATRRHPRSKMNRRL